MSSYLQEWETFSGTPVLPYIRRSDPKLRPLYSVSRTVKLNTEELYMIEKYNMVRYGYGSRLNSDGLRMAVQNLLCYGMRMGAGKKFPCCRNAKWHAGIFPSFTPYSLHPQIKWKTHHIWGPLK